MSSALQTLLATLDRLPLPEQKQALTCAVREVCDQEGVIVSEQAIEAAVTAQLAPAPQEEGLRPWTVAHWKALRQAAHTAHDQLTASMNRLAARAGLGLLGFLGLSWVGHVLRWDQVTQLTWSTAPWLLGLAGCFLFVAEFILFVAFAGPMWATSTGQEWDPTEATPEQKARWQACVRTREFWEAIRRSEVPLLRLDMERLETWSR